MMKRIVALTLLALATGCLVPVDIGGDAGTDGSVGGGSGGGAGAAAVCTFGQDQTCNDNPTISSLAGQCTSAGQCVCLQGMMKSAASGKCYRPAPSPDGGPLPPTAIRGESGCDAPLFAECSFPYEYSAAISCHPVIGGDPDAGEWYAPGGLAGAWCFPTPSACSVPEGSTTCACLMQHGVFSDAGALNCPGSYMYCTDDADGGRPRVRCNPP